MTGWSLFIDDDRFPVDDGSNWRIARNLEQALFLIETYGLPDHIAFDHDLGEDAPTGHEIAQKLVEMDLDKKIDLPKDLSFYVHSQNPVGAKNIEGLLTQYLEFKEPR